MPSYEALSICLLSNGVLFPTGYQGDRIVVILRAYCDESTVKSRGVRVATVAGGVGKEEGWDALHARWKAALDEHGLKFFHMTDFETREKAYKGWSEEKRVSLLLALIDAVNLARPKLGVFSCCLVVNDYEALPKADQKKLGKPYDFCSRWLIRQIGYFMNRHRAKGLVAYVFARRPGIGNVRAEFDKALKKVKYERRLASMTDAPMKLFTQLQAADIFAYEAGKSALRDIGADPRPHRKSLQPLLDGTLCRGYLFDGTKLRELLDGRFGGPLCRSDLDRRPC